MGRTGRKLAPIGDAELRRWLEAARAQLPEPVLLRLVKGLTPAERFTLDSHWPLWWHERQAEPPASAGAGPGDWLVWLMMAGRGFGKTRAGAEWLNARARESPGGRLALVGASIEEVVAVMVKGRSGLIAVAATGEEPVWAPSKSELAWPNGTTAFAYSGGSPDKLRGPEHHFAWCDELAKWRRPKESWDNLMMGMRLGEAPRIMVTTTPRPVAALRAVVGAERTVVTGGRTADNPHLPASYLEAMTRMYGGTRIGRQELDGMLFEDVAGALWTRDAIEAARRSPLPAPPASAGGEAFRRVVVGVDPPASVDGDSCGIVVCALGADGIGYVLADHTAEGLSPSGWAAKVAAAALVWGADRVIAEANNGGAMVEEVLRGAATALPVRLVHAAHAKVARAEPVAALFESGRVKLAGRFPELEDQLCGMTIAGGYEGPGRSPDRADAMVWALWALMLGPQTGAPRVMAL